MATHDLKTWPEHFQEVKAGRKRFEIRVNDRNFQVGDTLRLNEFCPRLNVYTGDTVTVVVTHMLAGGAFGIDLGSVVMSIAFPTEAYVEKRRGELIAEAIAELDAHHEWLCENPEQPDPGADAIPVAPETLLALLRNNAAPPVSYPKGESA